MTKQTRGGNRNGRRGDPNQDVQPWLGWIAAMLVVVIVVVAVAMGMERTSDQRNGPPEVRMTPLVGGMEVPVATETGTAVALAAEVTPLPEAISRTGEITMVTVITQSGALTETDTFTATGEMTPTETLTVTLTVTESLSETVGITTTTEVLTESAIVTATGALTAVVTITATTVATVTESVTDTVEATSTPTPRPTATPRPTVTLPIVMRNFEAGDMVVASGGRVEIYVDASPEAMVLDTIGTGIPLEVLDAGGDFESYPVEVAGHSWARVRAADGLVGWVMTDQVEAQ